MNYTVEWTVEALNRLAEVWTAAADRNAVVTASDRIDATLGADPTEAGESRSGAERVLIEGPLTVYYTLEPVSRTVIVFGLHAANRTR